MHCLHQPLRAAALLLCWALLASCGGGGGGGSQGAGNTPAGSTAPTNTVFDAVGISLVSPSKVEADYPESAYTSGVAIYIRADGDYLQLAGRTIYAIVEDPDSLLGEPYVSVDQHPSPDAQAHAIISTGSRQVNTPGHFQGEFKVHACLDKECRGEIAGSPLRIPYDVTVRAGMELDRQALSVTLPFGQVPPEELVTVRLPQHLASWIALTSTPNTGDDRSSLATTALDTGPGTGSVRLALGVAKVGTHVETALVHTNVAEANDMTYRYEKTITVTYTVTPDPSVDYVFQPAAANFTRRQGDQLSEGQAGRRVVANDGVTLTWAGVEYLSHPPAANGHIRVEGWWSELTSSSASCISGACLPIGTYTARVKYTVRKGATSYDAYWPITMQVVSP
jgi:hypothetical protein